MSERAVGFGAAPEAYDRHIGRYGRALARALIAAAGVAAGQRVLDVGCGPGALTGELVAAVGAPNVSAIDPSTPFVEACRARYPGVEVHVGAAESLPFAAASFDCALAQLAVNFFSNPPAGVREMRRVVRPGGVVAGAVWDYAGEMTLLRSFWDAAVALDPAAAARDEELMPFCTRGELGDLWALAGLAGVAVSAAVVGASYEGFEDLWAPLETAVAPSGAYAASLRPERRAALKAELRRRLGVGDAPFELSARAWIVTGTVS